MINDYDFQRLKSKSWSTRPRVPPRRWWPPVAPGPNRSRWYQSRLGWGMARTRRTWPWPSSTSRPSNTWRGRTTPSSCRPTRATWPRWWRRRWQSSTSSPSVLEEKIQSRKMDSWKMAAGEKLWNRAMRHWIRAPGEGGLAASAMWYILGLFLLFWFSSVPLSGFRHLIRVIIKSEFHVIC